MRSYGKSIAGAMIGAAVLFAAVGCQADFGADVTNKTPQPLFVQLFSKGNTDSMLAASKRLGPGDRGVIGPIRNNKHQGAYLTFDTLPNPARPTTVDLDTGMNFFEVHQDSESSAGPLVVIKK